MIALWCCNNIRFLSFQSFANSKYYKGGFEPKMTRREASLILGISPTASKTKVKVITCNRYRVFTSVLRRPARLLTWLRQLIHTTVKGNIITYLPTHFQNKTLSTFVTFLHNVNVHNNNNVPKKVVLKETI
jgi:hypothetical protein